MKKYMIDATVTIGVEDIAVWIEDDSINSFEDEIKDALITKLNKYLTLLDIKGGRSGDDGRIYYTDVDCLNNWDAQ